MKTYDKYKDSGVVWLGNVPEHWEVKPLFTITNLRKEINFPKKELLSVFLNEGVIKFSDIKEKRTNVTSINLDNYQLVKKGDFVLNNQQAWRGSVGVSNFEGIISPAYIVLELDNTCINYTFANYILRDNTMVSQYLIYSKGVGTIQRNLYWQNLKRIIISLPPLKEQQTIANYLDNKTTKINQAIEQSKHLITLLKEQKQALIQNAVTRGIENGELKMKNSGVSWLGEIPEHWEVKRLKHIVNGKLKYGANESGIEYQKDLPRYVRITDFGLNGKLSEENKLSLSWEKGKDFLLKDGDILFARSGATVGKTYQFRKSMSIENYYCYAGYLIKAEVNENIILSDYLYLYTNSGSFNQWKESIFIKATIENIGADKYSQLEIPLPPLQEQEEIVNYLDTQTAKIDKAITLQENKISKLQEFKISLINSVVTGKVKVEEKKVWQ